MGGPLDELLAGFRSPAEKMPLSPVHVRALEQDAPDHRAWVLAVWSDPGSTLELHRALRPRVEATLLADLARTPAQVREQPARYDALRLAVFPELEVEPAVRAFGLRRVEMTGPAWHQALAHLRHEAQLVGAEVADEPSTAWEADISHLEANARLEQALLGSTPDDEAFGTTPGAPFQRLATALKEAGHDEPSPDLAGLRQVEEVLVQRSIGPIRWIPPLLFQALCDGAALAAQSLGKRRIEWAECVPPEEGALAPPPLIRVGADGGWAHVPIGLEILRWCVMPLQPDEEVPPLADWLADAFR